jgi:DNA-binding protein YbaB
VLTVFSMAEIQAEVDQLNAEFAAVRERVREWQATEFTERIEPDLGTVTVLGTGELAAVALTTYQVTHYSGAALSRAVLEAIHRAERRVRADGEHRQER